MKYMRIVLAVILFLSVSFSGLAQAKIPEVDKSPLDMAYFPDNYPLLKIQDKAAEPMLARVVYSRPQKNGRLIFGGLIEYGKVWRLGANEATEIEFFQNVKINNVKIKKGRYTLYAIPYETKWTFILNKENDTWGSFRYDEKKDILRMDVPVKKQTETAESFSMMFEKMNGGFLLNALWDNVKTSLPVYLQ
jgi:hypothetical protein